MRLTFLEAARLCLPTFGVVNVNAYHDHLIAIAVAIGAAESSLNTQARHVNNNHSIDWGWLQINTVNGGSEASFDPRVCASQGASVYTDQGWDAWTVHKTGAFAPYMPAALVAEAKVLKEARTGVPQGGGKFFNPRGKVSGDQFGPDYSGVVPGIGYVPGGSVAEDIAKGAGSLWSVTTAVPKLAAAVYDFFVNRNGFLRAGEVIVGGILLLWAVHMILGELGYHSPARRFKGFV